MILPQLRSPGWTTLPLLGPPIHKMIRVSSTNTDHTCSRKTDHTESASFQAVCTMWGALGLYNVYARTPEFILESKNKEEKKKKQRYTPRHQ